MRDYIARSQTGFSIPAYTGAVAAGCYTMAAIIVVGMVSVGAQEGVGYVLGWVALLGPAVALLPAMFIFLPATLFSFWLANRFAWRSGAHFGALGALSAVATAVPCALIINFFVPGRTFEMALSTWPGLLNGWTLVAFAFAGVIAALTYRRLG